MARFFLPRKNIQNNHGTIIGAELDHLRRVLRLRTGAAVILFDDTGWEHEGVIRALNTDHCDIELVRSYRAEGESPLSITLGLSLTKGEKMDFVVEKATELGVQTIAPIISTYTVPRLDTQKTEKRTERWRKIALSAAKQSGRTRIPEILGLSNFREFLSRPWPDELKLIFWESERRQSLKEISEARPNLRSLVLMIGPEGGFTSEETAEAVEHGFEAVGLGRRILRAETAAVTALSLVQFLWGDLG